MFKRFAFQVAANYTALVFIELFKPFVAREQCPLNQHGDEDCLSEIRSTVLSLLVTMALIDQVMEVRICFILPRLQRLLARLARLIRIGTRNSNGTLEVNGLIEDEGAALAGETTTSGGKIHGDESSIDVDAVDECDSGMHVRSELRQLRRAATTDALDGFDRVVARLGYVTLFGVCVPRAAAVVFCNGVVEVRSDAWKHLCFLRHPDANRGGVVRVWAQIVASLTLIGSLVALALLTLTTPVVQSVVRATWQNSTTAATVAESNMLCFVLVEHILLLIRMAVRQAISTTPRAVYRLRAQQNFLIACLFGIGMKPVFRGRRYNRFYYYATTTKVDNEENSKKSD